MNENVLYPPPPAPEQAWQPEVAPPAWRPGDTVNGHTLGANGQWVPQDVLTKEVKHRVRNGWAFMPMLLLPFGPIIVTVSQAVSLRRLRKARATYGIQRPLWLDALPLMVTATIILLAAVNLGITYANRSTTLPPAAPSVSQSSDVDAAREAWLMQDAATRTDMCDGWRNGYWPEARQRLISEGHDPADLNAMASVLAEQCT
jgi:hypothetical protein